MNRTFVIFTGLFLSLLSCTNEKDETVNVVDNNQEKELILTIEPEYVLESSRSASDQVDPVMRVLDEKGTFYANLKLNEIDGFVYEEGYRYQLKVARINIGPTYGGSNYNYKCLETISKDYIGVSQKDKREVLMDVYPVRWLSNKNNSGPEVVTLRGDVAGSEEKLDMLIGEIYGMDNNTFFGNLGSKKIRLKASVTPTLSPLYEKDLKVAKYQISRRIRLEEVVSSQEMSRDSIIYVDGGTESSDTTNVDPEKNGSSYGDFEVQWISGSQVIGKGVLSAPYGQGYFTYSLIPGTDFAKFFVDLIYTDKYQEMKIVDSLTKGGKIQYNFIGNSADAYYFNIKWEYRLGANIDGKDFLILPYMDEENSTLLFDLKSQQWIGVLYINKVQLYSATETGVELLTEKVMSPLKLVFNTIKKLD